MSEPYKGYEADRILKHAERRLADALGMYADACRRSDGTAQGLSEQRVRELVRGDRTLRQVFRMHKTGVPAEKAEWRDSGVRHRRFQ